MKKVHILLYTIILLSLGYALNSHYRPFIYEYNINDYGLADIGNNLIFVPSSYFLILLFNKKPIYGVYKDVIIYFTFLSLIEVLSSVSRIFGTYDTKDVLGLAIGSFLTLLLIKINKLDKMNYQL
jgi:hypothetical protein